MMDETIDVFTTARKLGADFVGAADLAPARQAILEQGGNWVAQYPRALSIGIRLQDEIIDQLPNRAQRAVVLTWRLHAYDIINQRLDHITSRLAGILQDNGARALPVPASSIVDQERLVGIFSHKMAAHLAGLGWIGKSCLLITPEGGPRARWATILTDAALPVGQPMEVRCGSCRKCVDICPVQAFSGVNFRPEEPRSVRYDAHKCERYFREMEKVATPAACGLCMYICPHGRKS
jgi:epoxyqueuosine reductase QueG